MNNFSLEIDEMIKILQTFLLDDGQKLVNSENFYALKNSIISFANQMGLPIDLEDIPDIPKIQYLIFIGANSQMLTRKRQNELIEAYFVLKTQANEEIPILQQISKYYKDKYHEVPRAA